MKTYKKLFYLFFPLFLGGIVGFIIKDSIDYSIISKPFLSPPKILFPIAWTIIYLLMGISFYLYKKNSKSCKIDKVYYFQLFVNISWSIIFFSLKLRLLAVFWIILLLLLVIYLQILFFKNYKISFYLNILYMLWVTFATYLTIGIYILN